MKAEELFPNLTLIKKKLPEGMTDVPRLTKKGTVRKKAKGNARAVVYNGKTFQSLREAERYKELEKLEEAGTIKSLRCQTRYDFYINNVKIGTYVADFTYVGDGKPIVEDVKSEYTRKLPMYKKNRKLMQAIYGIDIKEVVL